MKIQIIQLEKYDDIVSVRDKLSWAQAVRVLLVWPRAGRMLRSRLDLVLVQRASARLGTQLGLVTWDRQVRTYARQLGIPVFSSVRQAQKGKWGPRLALQLPARPGSQPDLRELRPAVESAWPAWSKNIWVRLSIFGAGILAVLLLLLAFVPRADIVIVPRTRLQQITLPVLVSSQVMTLNISGNMPARRVSAVVEGQKRARTTGTVEVPDQFAGGVVRFINLTDQKVTIPVGTAVMAGWGSNPRYLTLQLGELDSGTGKVVDLPVRAVLPGEQGNAPAGVIQAIEGSLGLRVRVDNNFPLTGGHNQRSAGASQADLDLLRQQLQAELAVAAQKDMQAGLNAGDVLFPASVQVKNTLEETSQPSVDQPADELDLSLRLEFTALYVARADLLALGTAALDISLPAGYHALPESFQVEGAGLPEVDADANVAWHISAHRMIQMDISPDRVAGLAAGLTSRQASQRLVQELPLDGAPWIALFPSWWPRLPAFPFRIAVRDHS